MNRIKSFSSAKFPVAIIDVPWIYYGNPNKDQAAGKHYTCLTDEEVFALPVADVLLPKSVLFVWATSPRLDCAIDAIRAWGLHYRGIAFDWAKTSNAGKIINGQGARPSLVKHAGELVLWASFQRKGRPLSIKDEGMASWIVDEELYIPEPEMITVPRPNNVHSRKPEQVQDRIERLLNGPYLEIFARRKRKGWECFGNEVYDYNDFYVDRYKQDLQQLSPAERNALLYGTWEPAAKPFMTFKEYKK